MFNDPLGDKGGDYYQNPAESGASGVNAVAFHGGYQRIGPGSGYHWSDEIVPTVNFADYWDNIWRQATPFFSSDNGAYLGDDGKFHGFVSESARNAYQSYIKGNGPNGYWSYQTLAATYNNGWPTIHGKKTFVSFEKSIGSARNANNGERDMSTVFDAQVRATKDFFGQKSKELNSLALFPGTADLTRLLYFTEMVKTNAPFDLKNKGYSRDLIGRFSIYHGQRMRFDDYGNYNYGVAARAYGVTLDMAILGAGLNQVGNGRGHISNPWGWFDDPKDTGMIINGYYAIIK